jgi:hypothetical protein
LCLLAGMIPARQASAQELFAYTEPASNMPARAVGLRLSNWLMKETAGGGLNYHLIPEVMVGINKSWMVHAEAFVSNRNKGLEAEGGALYAKYRFYSKDAVHHHFRMAAFGRLSRNRADIHQEEIETNGHNSGYELGTIATGLLHKTALSASASFEQAFDNRTGAGRDYEMLGPDKAINYTASVGQLILPKKYTGYDQTNLNFMLELLGQWLPGYDKSYLDIAPSVQLIFNSQTRVDIGYRQQLYSTMSRTAPNGLLVRLEHNLFNAW